METETTTKAKAKYTNGEGFIAYCELILELAVKTEGFRDLNAGRIACYKAELRAALADLPEEEASGKARFACIMNLLRVTIQDYFEDISPEAKAALDLLTLLLIQRSEKVSI